VGRYWNLAIPISMAGIAGLVHDSWPQSVLGTWSHLHAVYGLLLCAMVVAEFQRRVRSSGRQAADTRAVSRQLARSVYLLLYVLFAASQLIAVIVFCWNRGMLGALHPAVQQPPENLRDYLAYGICALLTIYGRAALHRHMLKRSSGASVSVSLPPGPRKNPGEWRDAGAVGRPLAQAPGRNQR
jgi:cytochrome b561